MKNILLYIWQLPQNLIGLLILLWAKWGKHITKAITPDWSHGARIIYADSFPGGISLGRYVFLNSEYENYNGLAELHEVGHCRQSQLLGWLYLLVIGIPSIMWAAIYDDPMDPNGYYRFYTEKWADRLGGVKR